MLIVTGSIAYDYLMGFPGKFSDHILPEHAQNINVSFIVNSFTKHRGGTAGNISYTLGLLNTPHLLYAVAGKDFDEYEKVFKKLKINLDGVMIDKTTYTATGFAMADKSQNQIWGYYYGAAEKSADLSLKKVAKKSDMVIVGPQGAKGSMSFVNQSVKLGIQYMFDPGFILTEVSNEDLTYGIGHAFYIIGNEYEIELMKKRIPSWSTIVKEKTVITTLGEKGAKITAAGKQYKISPVKAKTVATTAGAGDAWRGGFLAGIEKDFDLQTAGQMGAVAGAYAVEHVGTQEHFYTKKEFTNRYKNAYNKALAI
jgi:adenosine kinase